jgi:hypothetical protein
LSFPFRLHLLKREIKVTQNWLVLWVFKYTILVKSYDLIITSEIRGVKVSHYQSRLISCNIRNGWSRRHIRVFDSVKVVFDSFLSISRVFSDSCQRITFVHIWHNCSWSRVAWLWWLLIRKQRSIFSYILILWEVSSCSESFISFRWLSTLSPHSIWFRAEQLLCSG